jgi:hypothetical protein
MHEENWSQRVVNAVCSGNNPPTLAVCVGYGFYDPDLFPLLKSLLEEALIIINERPAQHAAPDDYSGRGVLKAEFLHECGKRGTRVYHSDLLSCGNASADEASILAAMANALPSKSGTYLSPPSRVETKREVPPRMMYQLQELTKPTGILFWAQLLDGCGSSIGKRKFKRAYERQPVLRIRAETLLAYLQAIGADNAWPEGVCEAKALRKECGDESLETLCMAYEIFFRQMCGRMLSIVLCPGILRKAKKCSDDCLPSAKAQLLVQEFHFRVKLWSTLRWILGLRFGHVPKIVIKRLVQTMMEMEASIDQLVTSADPHLAGNAWELIAEGGLAVGDVLSAERACARAVMWRSFTGRASNSIQADRLSGWVELSRGTSKSDAMAIRYFARGLRRALQLTKEVSLASKLSANLVRVLWKGKAAELVRIPPAAHSISEVIECCDDIMKHAELVVEEGRQWVHDELPTATRLAVGVVSGIALYLAGSKSKRLVKRIIRSANPERIPVF